MERRSFLGSLGAAMTSAFVPSTVAAGETEVDIVAQSRDRQVRFRETEYSGENHVEWVIEHRRTGDTVYDLSFPREVVRHSYVTTERVFVLIDVCPDRRRTVEWFLQSDMARSRTVDRATGETRIVEYDADGGVNRRV